ncbi:MAG TPA: TylF/MycF/NovP-related O-methyltransferase [Nevskiales bacterium]|nr:TylF/MycF/NovP-related O-methyltransferase [Nevskiales bacterium]
MRNALQRLRRHLRQGTLGDVLLSRAGIMPLHARVRWHGAGDIGQAARALAKWARILCAQDGEGAWVLSVGDGGDYHRQLNLRLRRHGVRHEAIGLEQIEAWTPGPDGKPAAVLCAYPDSRRLTRAARTVAAHPAFAGVPFEYAAGLDPERRLFAARDEYADTFFVSPVLLDDPTPYALYEESLKHFEQKCGLRDFLDLYQLLRTVVENDVPGDIAEFGSYRGHSGWLIAQTLQALGSRKHLYLFDTFENFPAENLGLDYFWSRTHAVDFAEVQRKFEGLRERVSLVKGDFTRTLTESGLGTVALAYVDCDSYRATRFLIEQLLPERLSPRGVLVCEDYGHPALLGNRAAVHDSLDGQRGYLRYFSQFSGLYVVVKY